MAGQYGQPEPDYRMSLAAERTQLAYTRTALALLAAGVAVATGLPDAGAQPLRRGIGAVLVLLGTGLAVGSEVRYRRTMAAMRAGLPLPRPALTGALAVGLTVVALGALAVVLAG